MTGVVVLSAAFEPLSVVPLKRAMVFVVRERVQIIQSVNGATFRSASREFPVPKVIAFKHSIKMPYRRSVEPWSRRGVFARDGNRCGFCGRGCGSEPTIDHVIPTSRGGDPASWENTITAHRACNNRKADRTPEEAGMPLLWQPRKVMRYERLLVAIEATGADLAELGLVAA